ncbi:GAF domain-containing sensor histidine kinase [Baekduia soli]|nr:GAF domain-containing sensor histidine kinase [Baekduia soli]
MPEQHPMPARGDGGQRDQVSGPASAHRTTDSILELACSVLDELDLGAVLHQVLVASQELTGARYAALGVLNEDRTALARFVTLGLDDAQRHGIGSPPVGRGVLGELIADPRPLRLPEVGAHPRSYGFAAGHPPMTSFLGVPVRVRGVPFGNLYLTDKVGAAEFSEQDERSLVLLSDLAGVAIDHARRIAASEAQRDELAQLVAVLDATTQITRAVGGHTDLGAILRLIAKRGRALARARAVLIELEHRGELEVAAGAGELPPGIVGRRLPVAGTVAATALSSGETQRLEGPTLLRFERHGAGRLGLEASAGLVVPMVFHGRGHGVLVCLDRLEGGPDFTDEDQMLLESFASSAAVAVATAQTIEADRRSQRLAIIEQEKARWARELHDDTLQALGAVRLALEAGMRPGGEDRLVEVVGDVVGQLDRQIVALRTLITELRPATLDEFGPAAAIEDLAERIRAGGVAVEVTVDLARDHDGLAAHHATELETAVYRIVQESLTNAAKHGNGGRIVVVVSATETAISVVVCDDGVGFDLAAPTDGFGMLGIRERVELLGGTLEIDAQPGHGTTVTATLPVRIR